MKNRPLCINPGCAVRGQHHQDCADQQCRGCLPGLAADGLNLCQHHRDRLTTDPRRAAQLYDDLETPGRTGDNSDYVSGGGCEAPIPINPAATDARHHIRAILVAWVRLIADERGMTLPADNIHAIAAYIAASADWIAAHPAADDASVELAEAARHGHGIAHPTGTRKVEVASCPQPGCGGIVTAVLRAIDSDLPSKMVCDGESAHTWTPSQWKSFGRAVGAQANESKVDARTTAAHLNLTVRRVAQLVAEKVLTAELRPSRRGRPGMWFDLNVVEAEMLRHAGSGIVRSA